MQRQKRVYVAGPYTKGDVAVNVKNAIEAGTKLLRHGFAPYIPHLSHFWHMLSPQPYETWTNLDNEFLPICDVVLRLSGISSGADAEVALAEKLKIPIYRDIYILIKKEIPLLTYYL